MVSRCFVVAVSVKLGWGREKESMRRYTDSDKKFVRGWAEKNKEDEAALADGYRLCSETHYERIAASKCAGWQALSPEDVKM